MTDSLLSALAPPATRGVPQQASAVLADVLEGSGRPARGRRRAAATGFDLVDVALGGGIRAHDLVLLGGLPGVGKTIAALQMARQLARAGTPAIYACYEHDSPALLGRLLCLELGEHAQATDAARLEEVRVALLEAMEEGDQLQPLLAAEPLVAAAFDGLSRYADRLWLVGASGTHTGLAQLDALLAEHEGQRPVLFVDYLQKVAVQPEPAEETEKVTRIAEGLKELSLRHDAAVVAVVAADRLGLEVRRLRPHHLRGSSALVYEADVVILLNDKLQCVSKAHLAYDPVRAQSFRHFVVFTIEKNRSGGTDIDIEYRKDFARFRFEPRGSYVAERLVDERLDEA